VTAERDYRDELVEVSGDFDLSRASRHYLAATRARDAPRLDTKKS